MAGPAGGFRNSNLAQAWLVLILALGFGAALAAVQVNLTGTIAANKLNETLDKVPELVWGEAAAGKMNSPTVSPKITPGILAVKKESKNRAYPLYRVTYKERVVGWVIKAGGQGYADKIDLLIGLDHDAKTITGLFILAQKETPGLGNKIISSQWRNQFVGSTTHKPLVVEKGNGQASKPNIIDAVTGATISSRAVTGIVNRTIGDIKGHLTPAFIRFTERQN